MIYRNSNQARVAKALHRRDDRKVSRLSLRGLYAVLFIYLGAAACSPAGNDPTTELPLAAQPGSSLPHLAALPDGGLVLSFVEPWESGHRLLSTRLEGDEWSTPRVVAAGDNWLINWADFPSVVPISDHFWVAHWLVRQNDAYAYHVLVSVTADAGSHWSAPTRLHGDDTATEHGFVSLFPDGGAAGAIWLDGRDSTTHELAPMTLRYATISREGVVSGAELIDEMTCECCQTDVAVGDDGPIAVFRDRSSAEIRDIYFSRRNRGSWSIPQPVAEDGWKVAGCPVNGPAIDALGAGYAVAWYTNAGGLPRLRYSRIAGGIPTPARIIATEGVIGRADVVLLNSGDALVSWLQVNAQGGATINVRRVGADGALGPAMPIAHTVANRPAGFPAMQRAGDSVIFAWTDVRTRPYRVRTSSIQVGAVH